jgi:hypothetical protein
MEAKYLLEEVIQGTRNKTPVKKQEAMYLSVFEKLKRLSLPVPQEEEFILKILRGISEAGETCVHEYRWS